MVLIIKGEFGLRTILSCMTPTDASGQSKGFGFVRFEKKESAQNAIDKLNVTLGYEIKTTQTHP